MVERLENRRPLFQIWPGMAMPGKGASSMNMNMNNNMKTTTMNSKMTAGAITTSGNNNNVIIKNITEDQTAQSLAAKAQDILNKNLKPIAPPNAASANTQLDKDLSQLKTAIDNKAPFMDIMKIVHVQIHPLMIRTYNLPLR